MLKLAAISFITLLPLKGIAQVKDSLSADKKKYPHIGYDAKVDIRPEVFLQNNEAFFNPWATLSPGDLNISFSKRSSVNLKAFLGPETQSLDSIPNMPRTQHQGQVSQVSFDYNAKNFFSRIGVLPATAQNTLYPPINTSLNASLISRRNIPINPALEVGLQGQKQGKEGWVYKIKASTMMHSNRFQLPSYSGIRRQFSGLQKRNERDVIKGMSFSSKGTIISQEQDFKLNGSLTLNLTQNAFRQIGIDAAASGNIQYTYKKSSVEAGGQLVYNTPDLEGYYIGSNLYLLIKDLEKKRSLGVARHHITHNRIDNSFGEGQNYVVRIDKELSQKTSVGANASISFFKHGNTDYHSSLAAGISAQYHFKR